MSPSERYSIVFQTVEGVDEIRMESLRPVLVQVSHDGVNIDSWHCVPVLPEAPVRDVLSQISELNGQRLRVAVQAYGRLEPPLPDREIPIKQIPPYLRVDILGDASAQKRFVPVSIAAPAGQRIIVSSGSLPSISPQRSYSSDGFQIMSCAIAVHPVNASSCTTETVSESSMLVSEVQLANAARLI